LRDRKIAARVVEVLQSNQGACVGVDAVSHFSFSFFVFDISDAVLAVGSILLGVVSSRTGPQPRPQFG
jgi:lipoprotein signal peptidase